MDEFAIGKKQPNIVFILIIFGFKIDPSYLWLSTDLGTSAWNQKKMYLSLIKYTSFIN